MRHRDLALPAAAAGQWKVVSFVWH